MLGWSGLQLTFCYDAVELVEKQTPWTLVPSPFLTAAVVGYSASQMAELADLPESLQLRVYSALSSHVCHARDITVVTVLCFLTSDD